MQVRVLYPYRSIVRRARTRKTLRRHISQRPSTRCNPYTNTASLLKAIVSRVERFTIDGQVVKPVNTHVSRPRQVRAIGPVSKRAGGTRLLGYRRALSE